MERFIDLAKQIIEKRYAVVGIRSLCKDEKYQIGDICRDSYEWDFENDCSTYYTTGETAGGTCATRVDLSDIHMYCAGEEDAELIAQRIAEAVERNAVYGGQQVVIAGYESSIDGHYDDGEIRIHDAEVIMII